MILLLDAGNSRLKWALADDQGLSGFGDSGPADPSSPEALQRLLKAVPARVERVVVANVAGERFAAALTEAAQSFCSREPEFVVAAAEACGLRCAYAEPRRLGADRWAAVIAAHSRSREPAVVVGAGTALTLDALADGEHLGGLILPGLALMAQSLSRNTSDIGEVLSVEEPGAGVYALGRSTAQGVSYGAVWALVGAVERVRRELLAAWPTQPHIYLTGGAAPLLIRHLSVAVEQRPYLVLEGLAYLAGAGKAV